MTSLLQKLSLGMPVDKFGPRILLVVNIGPETVKCVLLSRNGRKISVDSTKTVNIDTTKKNLLKTICKETGFKSKYCSVILKERDEQVRLLRMPSKFSEVQEINKFITESFGAEKGYISSYQVVGEGGTDKLILAGLLKRDRSQELKEDVEAAGFKPVSLGQESISLINLSLDLSTDDQLRAFLHIGEISSILTVTQGDKLKFVHTFPHGHQCILESIMNGMELDADGATKILEVGTENFDAYMDMEVVSWMHQIALSLDFAERDFGLAVDNVCVYGPGAKSDDVRSMLGQQTYREVTKPNLKALFTDKFSITGADKVGDEYILPIIEGAEIMLGDLNNEN